MKPYYLREWKFFRTRLLFIFIASLIVMILFATITCCYLSEHPNIAEDRAKELRESSRQWGLSKKSDLPTFFKLFFNNSLVAIESIALGIIPFVFLPTWFIRRTGNITGFIVARAKLKGHTIYKFIIKYTHAIIEIPTIIYAETLGMWITIQVTKKIIPRCRKNSVPIRALVKQVCSSYFLVIIPLLFVAAIIEVFVSFQIP